ncbi:MAG: glucuronate isomerase [Cytophagales bacterium]|uniref:glucuronate isomerase n=1 Tax=Cyclobacterium marinum TaxID=104 RepID=UPI0011EE259F|nr:glucuronate isomerase [Cyclobacterium marinum]MBI0399780.1 glucuronate isomerase [Cyclobacterium marinum]MBR9777330.1 glucuronate isomerase [Cytophagales bacterium]|tara:strand:- start:37940 stop:39367 length:1428 start_codon:yes stop_codon:yes gene_type:complete
MQDTVKPSNNTFLTEDFLLKTDFSKRLYHDYAKKMPIIDYHCHLSPKDIALDRQFNNMSTIWLEGDHYKWRAMRTLGVDEKYITGDSSDQEKFENWAKIVPQTMRNPLYHWTHLELKGYFGIDKLLNESSASEIYNTTTNLLQQKEYSTRGLLSKMNVEVVCTTDDPIDSLEYHQKAKADNIAIKLLPTFRPDKAYAVENPSAYISYLEKLANASGLTIHTFDDLLAALENRVAYFHENGGRLSDHGLEQLYFYENEKYAIDTLFASIKKGESLQPDEVRFFKFKTLTALSKMYHAKSWTQQYHLGALRNTNERMLRILGPDTGFDSIGDFSQSVALAKFLNNLDSTDQLSKTILYNLNPSDNEVMATMVGNFNDGSIKGKVQFGSGWWYLDQKDGMEKQINTLSNMGILSCFVGMLTDSRSFLSFPRHEYFRRILCNLIGQDVSNGELPADEKWLGQMVEDICYRNARNYFGFY